LGSDAAEALLGHQTTLLLWAGAISPADDTGEALRIHCFRRASSCAG